MTQHDNVQFLYVAFQVKQLRDKPRTESNTGSSGGSGNMVHPTLANLYRVAARLDHSSSRVPLPLPEAPGLDHKPREDESNSSLDERSGGFSETAADLPKVSKGKGKAKADGGCLSGVSEHRGTRGIDLLSLGFPFEGDNVSDGLGGENGGSGSSLASVLSDMTRALGEPLHADVSTGVGVTTFEAEESGLLRALLRALLNGSIATTPPLPLSGIPGAEPEAAAAASNSSSTGEAYLSSAAAGLPVGSSPGMVGHSASGWSSRSPNDVGAGGQILEATSTGLKGNDFFVEVRLCL